ncbi:MAG: hypothetical protein IPI67_03695 [Myxococcales bacterium]|nr:hypothetical protein [Myxococcales bacterium]
MATTVDDGAAGLLGVAGVVGVAGVAGEAGESGTPGCAGTPGAVGDPERFPVEVAPPLSGTDGALPGVEIGEAVSVPAMTGAAALLGATAASRVK